MNTICSFSYWCKIYSKNMRLMMKWQIVTQNQIYMKKKHSSDCFTAEVPPSVNRWESTSNVQHGVYSSECHWWNTYTLRALVCLLLHPSLHPPHDSTCSLSFVFSTNMSVCQSPSVIRKWGEMFLHLSRKVGLHVPHTIQYLTSLLKKFISRIHVLHVNY